MSWRGSIGAVPVALALLLLPCTVPAEAAELQLVGEFGSLGAGPGQFRQPEDLAVAPGGNLLLSDGGSSRVNVFAPGGSFVRAFGSSGSQPGQFNIPWGIAIQANGTIFVEDSGNGRVEVFTAGGAYVREFRTPVLFYADIDLDPQGASLYLVDYQAGNIQRMSITGANMGLIGSFGTGPGQFQRPQGIAIDSNGNLFVADRDNNRVQKLSPNGAFLTQFGGAGSGPGQMRSPNDVAIDADGNVLVADSLNGRLQEFTPSGRFVASYDRIAGSPTPAFRPFFVTAAPSGDIYVYDGQVNRQRILRVRARPDAPTLGKDVNVAAVRGTVRVDTPGGGGFVPLDQASQIPVGSKLDTRRGTVRLTSARSRRGQTQTGRFGGATFRVLQARRSGGLTNLRLLGGKFGACGSSRKSAPPARLSKRVIRRLSAQARRGRFRTRGRYAAATVRGTVWSTVDRCDGTLTRVKQGSLVVRDLVRRRNVIVRAGQRYLARAPGA